MTHPITAAFAVTPDWMLAIQNFDGLEIAPCQIIDVIDGKEIVEVCEPEDAHFWTVYGHCRTGGVEAFEDFPDPAAAQTFAQRLLETYPHLRQHGLLDMAGGVA